MCLKNTTILCLISIVTISLSACDNRGELPSRGFVLETDVANSYLTFLNTQQEFSSTTYQMVILPEKVIAKDITNAGYSVSMMNTSNSGNLAGDSIQGNDQAYSGKWNESSDLNWESNQENSHDINLSIHKNRQLNIQCSQACSLFIVKSKFLYRQVKSSDVHKIQYDIVDSGINSASYAQKYYQTVDPGNERTTLDAWKRKNGFEQGHDVHVIFRDSKDLGYGRDMYARRNDDGSLAFFVNNFVVAVGKGNPANYGPLNLLAATDQNFDYHLGSNAIEFSAIDPNNPDSDKILKFFTFSAKNEQGVQARITSADLDGRGVKHMPSICLACHGGNLLPLNPDGSFNELTLKSAKLNQLELDSFEFMDSGEFSEAEQQAGIKKINQWARDSYAVMGQRDQAQQGFWQSDFPQDIANSRYGDKNFGLAHYQENTVPVGWQQTAFRPDGVENLYRQVVEPHCISCHSIRGYKAGDDSLVDPITINDQKIKLGNAINFSSYEKFISYSEVIIDYVYLRGVMPLSLRNAEKFWQVPYSAPALLASFLPNFDVLNKEGKIEPPGLPIARLPRQQISALPMTLQGSGSYFAKKYQWSIISGPDDNDLQLKNEKTQTAQLTGTTEGEYVLALKVSNSRGESSKTFALTVDNRRKLESSLNFIDDIKPLLQNQAYNLRTCQSCHNPVTGIQGVPVFYDGSNVNLYADVKARVNLKVPLDSLLLLKPSRHQHGGGIRFDLETTLGLESYNTILQWVIAGAPCGTDSTICP